MTLKLKNKGFTLIELMVVIVIIGVLASLAIPRFTEASLKAKIAEAPRVNASYVSAQLASLAEDGVLKTEGGLIFEKPTNSKWWVYNGATAGTFTATAQSMNATVNGQTLTTTVNASGNVSNTAAAALQKYVPNFHNSTN